jgi:hypothetical protein
MCHVEGTLPSKGAAGDWARRQAPEQAIIGEALDARSGRRSSPLEVEEVVAFLDWIERRIAEDVTASRKGAHARRRERWRLT